MRAFVYCRISDDRVGAGLGVERQQGDCEALAASLGWTIVHTFVDNDLTAYSGKPRPGYLAMLDELRRGHADAVIAWHNDRLIRLPSELEEFIAVCEPRSIIVRTVKAGELDLSTPTGQMTARIVGAVSKHEIDHARQRMIAAHAQAAEKGKAHGRMPFGYAPVYDERGRIAGRAPDEKEAAVFRAIVDRVLAGESMRSIVADLVESSPAPGRKWSVSHLRPLLVNPTYAGLRRYKGKTYPGDWEPLISEETHLRLVALLSDPTRRTARGNDPRWLLSGIAECGVCGETMWRKKSNGGSSYQCTTNGCTSRKVEPVDMLVEAAVVEWAKGISDISELADPDEAREVEEAREQARILQARLDAFTDQAADGGLTPAALARIEAKLLPQIQALTRRAEKAAAPELVQLLGSAAPVTWSRMALEAKRTVIRSLLRVTIHRSGPGPFDPNTVRVEWR